MTEKEDTGVRSDTPVTEYYALNLTVSTSKYNIRKTGREKKFINANNSDDCNWNTNEFTVHVNGSPSLVLKNKLPD